MICIIVDDDVTSSIILEHFISKIPELQLEGTFTNALQAIKFLNQNSVDLIFLDIHMPDFTGFDLMQTLKNPPLVILTTSDKGMALEAFEYESVVDFIVKPITIERCQKAVQKALNFEKPFSNKVASYTPAATDLYVNIDKRLIKINLTEIKFIEASGDYIQINTDQKRYTVHTTLKKIEEKLPEDIFLKVHRSFIINIKRIVDIEDNSVLIGKSVIPVSRSSKSELMKRLNLL